MKRRSSTSPSAAAWPSLRLSASSAVSVQHVEVRSEIGVAYMAGAHSKARKVKSESTYKVKYLVRASTCSGERFSPEIHDCTIGSQPRSASDT